MRTLLPLAILLSACGPQMSSPDAGGGGNADCRDLSKSPVNLLANPGFECDTSPATWSGGIYGTFDLVTQGRSGRAGQVTVKDALGGRFAYARDVVTDAGTKTYCVRAWVTGTAPFMRMRVLRSPNNTAVEQVQQIFSDWRPIPASGGLPFTGDNAAKVQLVFEIQTGRSDGQNGMPGQIMLIDDVDVWESSANCSEPR